MSAAQPAAAQPCVAWLPLALAIAITLGLTIYPLLLLSANGLADHRAALFAFWAMSAGYVRGVGFIPRHRLLRWIFSTGACLSSLAVAILLIIQQG